MNSSPLSLVYSALTLTALASLLACSGPATTTFIDPTEASDAGPGSNPSKNDASTPTTTTPPKAVSAATACSDFAKARCAREKSCSAFLYGATWGDDATCEARHVLGCEDKLGEPGVTWKPEGLAKCAAALPSASCDDLAIGVVPSECAPSAGTLAAATACAHDEQCSTGFCKKGSFGACGSCAEHAKEGAFCSQGADCAAGLVCAGSSCRVPATQGQSCNSSKPCFPGLVCNAGTCGKGAPAGRSCGDSPSSPDLCDHASGVFCSSLLMQCMGSQIVATGATCNAFSDLCAAGGTCDGFGSSGQCIPAPKEGDDCTVSGSGAGCFLPSVCDNGKCTLPSAAACTK